jgi:hypothetical protein
LRCDQKVRVALTQGSGIDGAQSAARKFRADQNPVRPITHPDVSQKTTRLIPFETVRLEHHASALQQLAVCPGCPLGQRFTSIWRIEPDIANRFPYATQLHNDGVAVDDIHEGRATRSS